MPRESNLELKVGSFILAAIIGLVFFIFSITDTAVFDDGNPLSVVFSFASGLKKSAPVRVAGVDKGVVKDIRLFFDTTDNKTKVEVELWLKKDVMLPIDSVVFINHLGMMGEKYIEITPGKDTHRFFSAGQILKGKDPIAQEEISERIIEVANKLEESIEGVNKVITDKESMEALGNSLKNFEKLTGDLSDVILEVKEGNGIIGSTFKDFNAMTLEFKDILDSVKEGNGTVGKLIYDESLYDNLEGMTSDLKENPWKLLQRPKKVR